MVMKEKGISQKHLEPLGLQAQWPEITSGAKQAQALASGDLDIGGVMNTASVLMANGEGNPVRIIAGVARPTDVFAIVAAKGGPRAVADLKGKTVAGPKGTVLHQLLACRRAHGARGWPAPALARRTRAAARAVLAAVLSRPRAGGLRGSGKHLCLYHSYSALSPRLIRGINHSQ